MKDSGILHLATDEKFINAANHIFEEAFPGKNHFVIVQPPANPRLKYVKLEPNCQLSVQGPGLWKELLSLASRYAVVVLHGLDSLKSKVFLNDGHKGKYVWMIWGAEVYNNEVCGTSYLGPATSKLASELSEQWLLGHVKDIYRKLRYGQAGMGESVDPKWVIRNIANVGILHEEEISQFKEMAVINRDAAHVRFTYYPIEFVFKDTAMRVQEANILLGNSASLTNNHVEAIDLLSRLQLGNRKVYIPLSYGDARYGKAVASYAARRLGDSAVGLDEYLPLNRYNELMSGCGIVIVNAYRQQAVGNILAALYLGAKVYLNNTTVYRFLKRIGCAVFSVEADLLGKKDALELLSREVAERNRAILLNEFSMERVVVNLRRSFAECGLMR